MPTYRYILMQYGDQLQFVEMPYDYAYQLSALSHRLHKEFAKLTATKVPLLPEVIAECDNVTLESEEYSIIKGIDYMNELENSFSQIDEKEYPLISLLTEIRALQAQLEQWYEEEAEEQAQ